MSRIVQIVDGELKLDHAAISVVIGEDYAEWKLECIRTKIALYNLDNELFVKTEETPIDDLLITKLLTLNLTAGNHLRALTKRFFDEPPSRSDINEMRSWLDNVLHYFDGYTLKELLTSCLLDLLLGKKSSSFGTWRICLETLLQKGKRAGVCMYPTCRSLRQTFACSGCSAQFCSTNHLELAKKKKYHFHDY